MMVETRKSEFVAWCEEHGGYPLPRHQLGLRGVCEECGQSWPCIYTPSEIISWREMIKDLRRKYESERNGVL